MNNLQKKRILLLGGEGFIGRNIAKELSTDFDCYSLGLNKSIFTDRRDEFMQGNPYIDKIANKYDVAIHLIDNNISLDDFRNQELNLIKNIAFSSVKHCVLFSSAVIYANPDSDYAKRKILLENIYEEYCQKNKIKLTIFRLFNIYGEFQIPFKQGGLVANLMINYLNNKVTEINDMNTRRDFIFASDMVKFVRYVIENEYCGLTDIATEKLITIKELIEILEKDVMGEKLQIKNNHKQENLVCPLAKNELANKVLLGSMSEGLRKTLDFYKNNLLIIK